MLIGECLPKSCSTQDVLSILKSSSKMSNPRGLSDAVNLDVLHVKKIPGSYDMWKDVKFFIVGGVGVAILVLMIVASAYESYINVHNREKDETRRNDDIEIECQNNNYTHVHENGNGVNGSGNGNAQRNGSSSNLSENGGIASNSVDICEKVVKSDRKKLGTGLFSQILLSFSIISNTEKIMRTEDSTQDSISCIHGLRFLSLAWVIMVHTYLQLFTVADNKTLRIITERNFFYQTVGNASYSVDTFFFISGFLITFLYFKTSDAKYNALMKRYAKKQQQNGDQQQQDKSQYAFTNPTCPQQTLSPDNQTTTTQFTRRTCSRDIRSGVSEFGVLMFYRVVRLTPAYLFVIGINQLAFRYVHNNSVFELNIYDHVNCDKNWWRNILYINNFFPQSEMCMLWSWYMANDTQFYVVGAILILLSKRYFKVSSIVLVILMITSWLTTGYISITNNYKAKIQEPFEMFDLLYDKPWSRLGPYLIGMATGWYVYKCGGKVTIPWWLNLISWPCAMGIVSSLIYGMKDGYLDQWPTAFYVSIGHTAWGVSVAWIVLYCISAKDGILNKLLSYRGILPLSRLAYCAYLVHPTIMVICSYQLDGPFHLHNGIVLVIYAGNAVMSYLMSYAISVAFEAPVVRLLKISKRR
ncbi:nose resistant to fluoxetine protein 6-like [Arctopsyche grandis]|uniref:nose resistant to fluoxetine protein 6-like n=1 Tax=Arctopsyche grandis TaxID=121162 RepID=UPI00406D68C8